MWPVGCCSVNSSTFLSQDHGWHSKRTMCNKRLLRRKLAAGKYVAGRRRCCAGTHRGPRKVGALRWEKVVGRSAGPLDQSLKAHCNTTCNEQWRAYDELMAVRKETSTLLPQADGKCHITPGVALHGAPHLQASVLKHHDRSCTLSGRRRKAKGREYTRCCCMQSAPNARSRKLLDFRVCVCVCHLN